VLPSSKKPKKKAPFYNEALKGSLNLKVSKGPEETTGRNKVSNEMNYLRVFPWLLGGGQKNAIFF
jgi:hypothetical protein